MYTLKKNELHITKYKNNDIKTFQNTHTTISTIPVISVRYSNATCTSHLKRDNHPKQS